MEETFDRQHPLFGKEGQEKIKQTHVGIIGVGGTGSHIVQQLAYLGVKKFTIIDSDVVEVTNLNRLIGASARDLKDFTKKIINAVRMIHSIRSEYECSTNTFSDHFPSKASLKALEKVDIIFGCVDRDGPRLILTEFSSAYEKPYIDLATEIHPENKTFGGRVFFSIPGQSCLHCRGELSPDEIRQDLQSDAENAEEERIYGVLKRLLHGSGPSVVSLNGIIASLAVTEFMVFVTGLRKPKEFLVYDGTLGIVKNNNDNAIPNCFYCNLVKGIGKQANIERYIRELNVHDNN